MILKSNKNTYTYIIIKFIETMLKHADPPWAAETRNVNKIVSL